MSDAFKLTIPEELRVFKKKTREGGAIATGQLVDITADGLTKENGNAILWVEGIKVTAEKGTTLKVTLSVRPEGSCPRWTICRIIHGRTPTP